MKKLVSNLIVGALGLYLASVLVPGVLIEPENKIKIIILAGLVLGVINFLLRPIVNLITLPFRILTFGLFGLIINMGLVWLVDFIFPELTVSGLSPLFWTGLIIWILNLLISRTIKN